MSRNLEKVLKVLEFILTHDSMFVTNNYLISNGYISRRRNIVRAGHGGEYNYESINTINEVSDINGENLKEALLASVKND